MEHSDVFITESSDDTDREISRLTAELAAAQKKPEPVEHICCGTIYCEYCHPSKQSEPEQGGFTKLARAEVDRAIYKAEGDDLTERHLGGLVLSACDIIDRQKRSIKLLKQCDDSSTKVIGEMDDELKAKDEALNKYGQHEDNCCKPDGSSSCDCGFEQALKG